MGYKYRISCVDYIIMGIIYRSMDIGERTFGLDGHNHLPIQTRLTRLATDSPNPRQSRQSYLLFSLEVGRVSLPAWLVPHHACG